jgi:uncharacterized iron-regulated protein
MRCFAFIAWLAAAPAFAGEVPTDLLDRATQAQVVILGEVHDNPTHHATQAAIVAHLQPAAIVFEMLTPEQALLVTAENRDHPVALAEVLDWANSGWPDFAMYHPIFVAAPDAQIFGAAVPRMAARAAMQDGLAQTFGPDADDYGLTSPLPPDQQAAAETLQQEAHCNAMPPEMLPVMVDIQRLRDAVLARETLRAVDATAGPVVVITGNGHARMDGGVPDYIANLRPDLTMLTIGQSEEGAMTPGTFDAILSAPAVARPDPCAQFQQDG